LTSLKPTDPPKEEEQPRRFFTHSHLHKAWIVSTKRTEGGPFKFWRSKGLGISLSRFFHSPSRVFWGAHDRLWYFAKLRSTSKTNSSTMNDEANQALELLGEQDDINAEDIEASLLQDWVRCRRSDSLSQKFDKRYMVLRGDRIEFLKDEPVRACRHCHSYVRISRRRI